MRDATEKKTARRQKEYAKMADDKDKNLEDVTKDDTDKKSETIEFEKWIKTQPVNVQAAYGEHTSGLTSALAGEREKTKTAQQSAKALQDRQEADTQKRLSEQGEYKELSTSLNKQVSELQAQLADAQATASKHDELSAIVDKTLESRVAQIPEEKRALLDNLPDTMTSSQKLKYINDNQHLLLGPDPARDWGQGAKGSSANGKAPALSATELEFAKSAGMTPEEYAKGKDKDE